MGPRLTLGETGSEQTRDLLDQSLGSQESVVLLGELLDELLVLVEPTDGKVDGNGKRDVQQLSRLSYINLDSLLQVLNGHVLELDLLGLVDVGSVGQDADGHPRPRDVGELDGTRLQHANRLYPTQPPNFRGT